MADRTGGPRNVKRRAVGSSEDGGDQLLHLARRARNGVRQPAERGWLVRADRGRPTARVDLQAESSAHTRAR